MLVQCLCRSPDASEPLPAHDVSLIRYLAEGPPASLQATVIDINELSEPRHDLADDSCPFSWLWMFGETSNTASTSSIEQIVTRGLVSRACVNLLTVSTAAPTTNAWRTTTITTDVRVFTAPLSPSDTHRVLTALYDGDELSTGSNRSPQAIAGEHVREVGLMSMLGPAANPYEYWPDHRPSRWNRKVVRYFTETGGVVDKLKSSWATTKSELPSPPPAELRIVRSSRSCRQAHLSCQHLASRSSPGIAPRPLCSAFSPCRVDEMHAWPGR